MTLEQMVYYINSAFSLELARPEELVMHFTQIRYIYNMFVLNRKNMVRPLIEDLLKIGMVNADDINSEITPKFKQKRKKMTSVQKQMCDEMEFF